MTTSHSPENDKYQVWDMDHKTLITVLNAELVIKQGIDDKRLEKIKHSHRIKHILFELARLYVVEEDYVSLKLLAKIWTDLEFSQQLLWGFAEDARYHHWFDLPGCTCPKMDNLDRLGTNYQVITRDCPIHGDAGDDTHDENTDITES